MMTKLRLLYDHEAGVQLANPYLRPVIIHAPDSIESLTLAEEAFDRGFTKTKLYQDGWRLAGNPQIYMLTGKFLKKHWDNIDEDYEQLLAKNPIHLTVVK